MQGVHTVAYSPLGHSKTDLLANPVVIEAAKDVGVSPAQVGLSEGVDFACTRDSLGM